MLIFKKIKEKYEAMNKEIILGLLRHSLTFLGGVIVAKGIADQEQVADLMGGVMTVIGAVWSILAKKKQA
jgi:hypothetical protein